MKWHMVVTQCPTCKTIGKEPVDEGTIEEADHRYKNARPRVMCDSCLRSMCSPEQFARWQIVKEAQIQRCEPMP